MCSRVGKFFAGLAVGLAASPNDNVVLATKLLGTTVAAKLQEIEKLQEKVLLAEEYGNYYARAADYYAHHHIPELRDQLDEAWLGKKTVGEARKDAEKAIYDGKTAKKSWDDKVRKNKAWTEHTLELVKEDWHSWTEQTPLTIYNTVRSRFQKNTTVDAMMTEKESVRRELRKLEKTIKRLKKLKGKQCWSIAGVVLFLVALAAAATAMLVMFCPCPSAASPDNKEDVSDNQDISVVSPTTTAGGKDAAEATAATSATPQTKPELLDDALKPPTKATKPKMPKMPTKPTKPDTSIDDLLLDGIDPVAAPGAENDDDNNNSRFAVWLGVVVAFGVLAMLVGRVLSRRSRRRNRLSWRSSSSKRSFTKSSSSTKKKSSAVLADDEQFPVASRDSLRWEAPIASATQGPATQEPAATEIRGASVVASQEV